MFNSSVVGPEGKATGKRDPSPLAFPNLAVLGLGMTLLQFFELQSLRGHALAAFELVSKAWRASAADLWRLAYADRWEHMPDNLGLCWRSAYQQVHTRPLPQSVPAKRSIGARATQPCERALPRSALY